MAQHPLFNIDFEKEKKDEEYRQYRSKSNNAFHYPKDFKKPEKPWLKDQSEQKPIISKDLGKISPSLFHEREIMCKNETDLHRRLAMYKRLRDQVQGASVPYINGVIIKIENKINEQEGFND